MAYDFQVTVDCADPHTLAGWWAETLGWEVERQDEALIRQLVTAGHADESQTTTYRGRLVWSVGAGILHPDVPEQGLRRRVLFQTVPEGKTVKNRVHLDVRVGAKDLAAMRDTLTARGATFLHDGRQGPSVWITMADPEGNEFCISPG